MRKTLLGAALVLAGALGCAHPSTSGAFSSSFQPSPCADPQYEGRVRCGHIAVPEDYGHPQLRTISLNVAIVPAVEPTPGAAPLYFIDGGPGDPATRKIAYYLNEGAGYRRHRDIVLFDMRGTGLSNPLHCPEITLSTDPDAAMFPPDAVARCAANLAARADVTQYTTAAAARDIDVVRTALGQDKIDLYAGSYGTTLSLYYAASFPSRVHAAVLVSVAPQDLMPPAHHAQGAQRALDLTLETCRSDPTCHAAYPDLQGDVARARARLSESSATIPVADMFMEGIRRAMYTAAGNRRVPMLLHRAAEQGRIRPEPVEAGQIEPDTFADGLYLAMTCAESLARMDYDAMAAEARETAFNDYRLTQQRDACRAWPHRRAGDGPSLTRISAPVLMISGNLDPVTPPQWAAAAARSIPHARQVLVAEMAHIYNGMTGVDTCMNPMLQRFYDDPNLARVDASCVASMHAPAFAMPAPGQ